MKKINLLLVIALAALTGCHQTHFRAVSSVTQSYFETPVYFDFASREVLPREMQTLKPVAKTLRQNGRILLVLEGHADAVGSEEANLFLGDARARAVRKALVDLGVRPERLVVMSYGESRPAVLGRGLEADAKNRRVSFRAK